MKCETSEFKIMKTIKQSENNELGENNYNNYATKRLTFKFWL